MYPSPYDPQQPSQQHVQPEVVYVDADGVPLQQQPGQPMQIVVVQGQGQLYPRVTRTKVGGGAHSVHLLLTVFTCGAWAPVWFLHWLFTRSKTVTR